MNKLISLFKKVLASIPTPTPIGRTAFNMWASSVFDTFGLPNTPGYREALCQMLLQEKRYFVSKLKFAIHLRKAQVNETAYQLMKEVQDERKQLKAAESAPNTGANGASQAV